ncbi:hypothetical protein AAHC03_05810 [Spirometra sp. Aus1]
MKLLDDLTLESLIEQLSRASRRYVIDAKLENYSCKMVSEEKRQYKDLVSRLENNAEDKSSLRLSPSRTIRGLRELTGQPIARSSYQMSTCQVKSRDDPSSSYSRHNSENASSSEDGVLTPPSEFSRLSITAKELFCLMSTLNLSFGPSYDFLTADSEEFCLEPELWSNTSILIPASRFFYLTRSLPTSFCSYRPDHASDPYSSGCLASFNYFFYNRDIKRILFFSLRVLNESPAEEQFEEDMQDLF